jgi:hypothetical protein
VTRVEFVRRLVLNSICDDGENVDQIILSDVNRDAAKCGLKIGRSEVVDAMAELVKDGLAKAWLLSPWPGESREVEGMPPMDIVEEFFKTYFFITEEGMNLRLSHDTWRPFDDEGDRRSDWHLDIT